jgi:signal transduction histidine kinase
MLALIAAQAFAIAAVRAADRAGRMARELVRFNADLRAMRELLDQTARAHERVRISRELHDVLGHDLTALGLQLEIAANVPGERAAVHLAKASEVSARLLRDVRGVVGALRDEPTDLGPALRTLADGAPGLAVHLDMPDALHVGDPARGHCLLRCVQEIITNALRHSQAENLWITIASEAGATRLDARDDGRGARELRAGFGLTGMQARLEEMGGWLRVDGARPAFEVSAWLPGAEAA